MSGSSPLADAVTRSTGTGIAGFSAALEGWQEHAVVIQGELNLVLKLVAEGGLGDLLVFRAAKGAPPLPAEGAGVG